MLDVRKSVRRVLKEGGVCGASLAVWEHPDEPQDFVFGKANAETGQRVTRNSAFRARALGLPVIGLALLRLEAMGRLSLDEHVTVLNSPDRSKPLADRQDGELRDSTLGALLGDLHWSDWRKESSPEYGIENPYEPVGVLRRRIEEASGIGFADAMATLVLRPLQMTRSGFGGVPRGVRTVTGHAPEYDDSDEGDIIGRPVPFSERSAAEVVIAALCGRSRKARAVVSNVLAREREGELEVFAHEPWGFVAVGAKSDMADEIEAELRAVTPRVARGPGKIPADFRTCAEDYLQFCRAVADPQTISVDEDGTLRQAAARSAATKLGWQSHGRGQQDILWQYQEGLCWAHLAVAAPQKAGVVLTNGADSATCETAFVAALGDIALVRWHLYPEEYLEVDGQPRNSSWLFPRLMEARSLLIGSEAVRFTGRYELQQVHAEGPTPAPPEFTCVMEEDHFVVTDPEHLDESWMYLPIGGTICTSYDRLLQFEPQPDGRMRLRLGMAAVYERVDDGEKRV